MAGIAGRERAGRCAGWERDGGGAKMGTVVWLQGRGWLWGCIAVNIDMSVFMLGG